MKNTASEQAEFTATRARTLATAPGRQTPGGAGETAGRPETGACEACGAVTLHYRGQEVVLTKRERTVVKGLSEGKTVKELALEMGLSGKTVEFHSHNARWKIGTSSIARLTRFALATGISTL